MSSIYNSLGFLQNVLEDVWDSTLHQLRTSGSGGGGGGAVTVADAADITQGAKNDTAWDGATATPSIVSILKGLYTALTQKTATPATTRPPMVANTNATLLAANASRVGAVIVNEGPDTLYLKLGVTASATSYSYAMAALGVVETPYKYTGRIDAFFATGTVAQPVVTELAP